ncbi:MAG: hypothetical protein JNK53_01460 [Phycisphaerae bacterium]|nr:hypothetical protein [Phycisphaerae bacterium]
MFAFGGCTARLSDLQGSRTDTAALAAGDSGVQEVPSVFRLQNTSWAPIRVESARVPIGTRIATEPTLPTTVKPGGTLEVTVVSKLRASEPPTARRILLETKGTEPLVLLVTPKVTE